jgi:acyl transferase domain-containing protein
MLPTQTKMNTDTLSITGYSLRAPSSSSVAEFGEALREARDLTTGKTRYPDGHLSLPPRQGCLKPADIASFDAAFFGMSVKQAQAMDPCLRL